MNNKYFFVDFEDKSNENEVKNLNINQTSNNEKTDDFIVRNVNNIFSFENENGNKRILCIGQVQSGKTRNILEIIKKATELEYDLILFLGGTTELLRKQSADRLEEYRDYYESKNYLVLSKDFASNIASNLIRNKKIIITITKAENDLTNVYNSIKDAPLRNKKFLIIDDECDYGSVNTKKDIISPSSYHEKIEKISSRTDNTTLLSFTGTPFANILNSYNINDDSQNSNYKIVVLENSNDYCGLKKFNEQNCYFYRFKDNKNSNYETSSIYDTILIYLASIVKKQVDNNYELIDKNFQTQCLINIDQKTINHEIYKNMILKKMDYWLNKTSKGSISESFFKIISEENYNMTNFSDLSSEEFVEYYIPRIKELLKYFIDNKNNAITILNSKNKDSNLENSKYPHKIFIGGVLLSRGVTFKYLLTELILNYPQNMIAIDTLLQRCRWFGYRKNNLKYMSIIMTKELFDVFKIIEDYLNVFQNGLMDFNEVKNNFIELDKLHKTSNVRGTSYGKSK